MKTYKIKQMKDDAPVRVFIFAGDTSTSSSDTSSSVASSSSSTSSSDSSDSGITTIMVNQQIFEDDSIYAVKLKLALAIQGIQESSPAFEEMYLFGQTNTFLNRL